MDFNYFRTTDAEEVHPEPVCIGCGLNPRHLPEYIRAALQEGANVTPELWVMYNEGTYNAENGHFLCDSCYIYCGCPVAPGGWRAP